ncbi:hypothetical protein GCM10023194_06790 [Planotetraspora phitsanulokensis]|uniref:Uncharacterized protein n=1 Tax=Planotetraspora phitsanulokensis TaxID=575192 RepID=A0A8J3U6P2_9ACTN|nr:hypothetical protein Pph01_41780 [Planotetraspora phitsanulokensis]
MASYDGARACPAHLVPDLVFTRGTPPRTRGLPASEPGLDAGAHDLTWTITDRPRLSANPQVKQGEGGKSCGDRVRRATGIRMVAL